jgi:hypothetical protein
MLLLILLLHGVVPIFITPGAAGEFQNVVNFFIVY